ncbi:MULTISPECIES: MerR family transcriptional regulator [unclassified Crossiella]|uniref:MerR family transcriptional regulator n=1 Tax=unclassified Crossiella TaxID=2620835 RepID=UPI001FFF6052|nr:MULTISPECIES: MerR family transcriptional regulator [unclassified Crossiella]MCK2243267.1 MerR family transcriptional regulator [Crossiella sp. S99.2]MCK2254264.1 MerR family transcriptional regulator [Crossiella sp. S99.1]
MLSIGDFARHGHVSVRMLRHYDQLGLLTPDRVDQSTGYRYYRVDQLSRLNRVIALKDLGFTLDQVRSILDEQVDAAELRGMLRLRRTELAADIAAARQRLNQVEARLRIIESEGRMPSTDVVVKNLPAVRIAELTGTASDFAPGSISPVIGPLYDRLFAVLDQAGAHPVGPTIAYYELPEGEDGPIIIHAGVPVNTEAAPGQEFAIVDLPEVPQAATLVHHGSMMEIGGPFQALAKWVETNGYRPAGPSREFYLVAGPEHDQADWVTELQQPLVPA